MQTKKSALKTASLIVSLFLVSGCGLFKHTQSGTTNNNGTLPTTTPKKDAVVTLPKIPFLFSCDSSVPNSPKIVALAISATDGTLSTGAATTINDNGCISIAPAPSGQFLYGGNKNLQAFKIDPANGALTPVGTPLTDGYFGQILVSPNGKYLISNKSPITVYEIDSETGAVGSVVSTLTLTNNPSRMELDPSGRYLYAIHSISPQSITGIHFDQDTGKLGTVIEEIALNSYTTKTKIDPKGQLLYLLQERVSTGTGVLGINEIRVYLIGSNGNLTFLGSNAVEYGPIDFAFESDGVHAVLGTNYTIHRFKVDPTTGLLITEGTIWTVETIVSSLLPSSFSNVVYFLSFQKPLRVFQPDANGVYQSIQIPLSAASNLSGLVEIQVPQN